MNQDNVGTREACQRLLYAGIVLKTEKAWWTDDNQTWHDTPDGLINPFSIPRPSMAEVWREY
jgi:hypothetical protein